MIIIPSSGKIRVRNETKDVGMYTSPSPAEAIKSPGSAASALINRVGRAE